MRQDLDFRGCMKERFGPFVGSSGRISLGRGLQMVGLWPGAGQRVRAKDNQLLRSFLKGAR